MFRLLVGDLVADVRIWLGLALVSAAGAAAVAAHPADVLALVAAV